MSPRGVRRCAGCGLLEPDWPNRCAAGAEHVAEAELATVARSVEEAVMAAVPGLSLNEAARRLGVSRVRIRQLVAEGRLEVTPTANAGPGVTSWEVSEAELARFAALPRRNGRPPGKSPTSPGGTW